MPPAERAVGATNQQETQLIERIRSWLKRTALAVILVLPLAAAAQISDKPFSNEQLDQMLAQIALYPDSRAVSECGALAEWWRFDLAPVAEGHAGR